MIITRTTSDPGATGALAQGLASVLAFGDVVLLEGDLGAGKTTFARALTGALSVGGSGASSPTFVIANTYPCSLGGVEGVIHHIDAYRLAGSDDLDTMGWDAMFDASGVPYGNALALIEWPERIAEALPHESRCAMVRLRAVGESSREMEIRLPDSWSGRPCVGHLRERESVRCPSSGVWVAPTAASYPFADDRLRHADLYKWFSSSYGVTRAIEEQDLDEE
ncbi:MAG: tRNA (adenosine(37)-N6)-threonylcarbamoyltransferase complex ATPase subunit type 1 TsaE [Phycisphaerales bacterium]|nr:MAG: tRNA (adenosine(37)-N6)-threonylcarbamoyltransferase complex ATPase subunit type 1 TsaE [Phycisphaerales bacterium]